MRYKEFKVRDNGLEKKLGILGDTHIYTFDEFEFAEDVLLNYDNIAHEGSKKKSLYLALTSLLMIPQLIGLVAGTDRSITHPPAKEIAKSYHKNIHHIENNFSTICPLKQKIALTLYALVSIPLSPFTFYNCKKYGDPFTPGTEAYKKRKEMQNKKKSKISRFLISGYKGTIPIRDSEMASQATELLKGMDNLLIVCGERHLDGIVKNLHKALDIEEVKDILFIPPYETGKYN